LLYRRIFLTALLIVFSLHLCACGGEPKPTATATPAFSPMEIVTRAAEVMLAVESLHFNIERDGALVYIDDNQTLAFKRAEGDFSLPDQMRAAVRIITAFTPVDIGMVVLGSEQYASDPFTGQWGLLPSDWAQFNLAALFHPETGLQSLLKDGIIDLTLVGTEELEKQPHYHLSGWVNGERIGAATLGFIGDGDTEVQVWIGADDFYMRRLHIVEPATDPEDPTTWDLTFSRLGQPVEITAPTIPNS
jgi:lipoprotein LprG